MPRRIAGPCPLPGCPNRAGQCQAHKPKPRQERGKGVEHDRLRDDYQRRMDAGERFTCWRQASPRCTGEIDPKQWDLGHKSWQVHAGPECIPCNRATMGRERA